jgi:hypothetical protein
MNKPAGALRRACMPAANSAAGIVAGILSKTALLSKTTRLSQIVSMATAIMPSTGVHLSNPPDTKKEEEKPIRPLLSMCGPINGKDTKEEASGLSISHPGIKDQQGRQIRRYPEDGYPALQEKSEEYSHRKI